MKHTKKKMRMISFLLVFILTISSLVLYTQTYSLSQKENILSAKKLFVCGFFKPSAGSRGWYVGIWHYKLPKEVVWVANRDSPLSKPIGTLKVMNTNLVLLDQYGNRVWWTNVTRDILNKSPLIVELLDSGNLVLRYSNNDSYEWQSFDFPTDTLVSGMKLGWDAKSNINRTLRSWRGSEDPSSGEFTYAVERHELAQSFIRKKGVPQFRSDPWNTRNDVEEASENLTYGTYSLTVTKEEASYVFSITNETFFSVLRLSAGGLLNRTTWIPKPQQVWKPIVHIFPDDTCSTYNKCGANGLCSRETSPNCQCIDWFEAKDQEAWDLNDWASAGGCVRKTLLNCSGDGFVRLSDMKLPDVSESFVDRGIGLEECKDKCLEMCNCTAYANTDMKNGGSGCVIWVGDLIDLRKNNIAGQDLFVRLAATDAAAEAKEKRKKKSTKMIMLIVGVGIVLLLSCVIFVMLFAFGKERRGHQEQLQKHLLKQQKQLLVGFLQCAPMELVNVATATENFSDSNKIGQGGFGIVYKGMLRDGQAIAAKRLLKRSAQGMQGFTNEVRLIASVQHINLVQVLGYCFESDEMILVFEYLENSSLDTYIFDQTQSSKLNWEKRLLIINGIARGLLYLHQDSRCRIIHRDLKPSNILLDKDMVPKIADFGMARLFGSDETEASTSTVVGTYGYMSPEYAIDRICSVKSDVFSFGVLVLEIISGKRNTEFFRANEESLLTYIWRNWKEGKGLEMVDPVIVDSSPTFQPLRFSGAYRLVSCVFKNVQRIDRRCRL